VLEHNLAATGGAVCTIAITAPGADVLPWDEHYCFVVKGCNPATHRHNGKRGCRCEAQALNVWCETLSWRWTKLREAARLATKRALKERWGEGFAPAWIMARVWEPQRRGAPHLHLVLPFETDRDRLAAWEFLAQLRRLGKGYGFGRIQQRDGKGPDLQPLDAAEAARYLASYLTGRTGKKSSIRENIADSRLPRSLLWLTPRLTRETLVTMRSLRRARHLWASLDGRCDSPVFTTWEDGLRTAVAFRQVYPQRAGPLGELVDVNGELTHAKLTDAYETRRRLRPLFYETDKLRERGLRIAQWAMAHTAGPAQETLSDSTLLAAA
jgi:hypothetical protein